VDCVNNGCTFASIQTVTQLCDRLDPNPPNDKCEQAESQLMALMLNYCQGRVADASPIISHCTSNTTVGQSRAEADATLCDPARGNASCTAAQCESAEINSGYALMANSLWITKGADGRLILTWQPPYRDTDEGAPRAYLIGRRTSGDVPFMHLAETIQFSFVDTTAEDARFFEYAVTPVWLSHGSASDPVWCPPRWTSGLEVMIGRATERLPAWAFRRADCPAWTTSSLSSHFG
jgi:hypothetical protein